MKIIIAGPGCPKCLETEKNVRDASAELGIAAEITHLSDIREYAKFGIIFTPAVIVNDKVVVSGKVPTKEEIKEILKNL